MEKDKYQINVEVLLTTTYIHPNYTLEDWKKIALGQSMVPTRYLW